MNIKTSNLECIWKTNSTLGESVLWVKSLNSIFFVDIKKKKIFKYNGKKKIKKKIKVNKEIGFLTHVKKNIFLLGLQGELRFFDINTKKKIKSIFVEKNKPYNRLNDGKTDQKGRLWFGSMNRFERNIKSGSLYCLNKNLILKKVDSNYVITNGPSFINDKNFYHTDSKKKIIYKIKINKNLKVVKKIVFLKFSKFDMPPDGMTTDTNNNLWVCHYGGACISIFNKKGKKINKINLPIKNVTNCAFGGYKNADLYITSASKGLSKNDKKKYNLSGSLFKLNTNCKGKMSKSFNCKI